MLSVYLSEKRKFLLPTNILLYYVFPGHFFPPTVSEQIDRSNFEQTTALESTLTLPPISQFQSFTKTCGMALFYSTQHCWATQNTLLLHCSARSWDEGMCNSIDLPMELNQKNSGCMYKVDHMKSFESPLQAQKQQIL